MQNNLTVLISSCDRYSYLWDIQLQVLNKYWADCPYPVWMLSETTSLPNLPVSFSLSNFNTGIEPTGPIDWSRNLKIVLPQIQSDYILYMQEDYVPTKLVDQPRLDLLLDYIVSNKVNYIRFYTSPPGNGQEVSIGDSLCIKEITPRSQWRSSLMLAIWKRTTLLDMLNSTQDITPWQFERYGLCDPYDKFYCIVTPNDNQSDVIPFMGLYGSTNGFPFYPQAVEFLDREGIKKANGSNIQYDIKL